MGCPGQKLLQRHRVALARKNQTGWNHSEVRGHFVVGILLVSCQYVSDHLINAQNMLQGTTKKQFLGCIGIPPLSVAFTPATQNLIMTAAQLYPSPKLLMMPCINLCIQHLRATLTFVRHGHKIRPQHPRVGNPAASAFKSSNSGCWKGTDGSYFLTDTFLFHPP